MRTCQQASHFLCIAVISILRAESLGFCVELVMFRLFVSKVLVCAGKVFTPFATPSTDGRRSRVVSMGLRHAH